MINGMIFLLLICICIGLIYIAHKYFGKHEFYLLTVIFSIISFILSFKVLTLFGLNINLGTIFTSALLILMYYFVNRFSSSEIKKYLMVIMISIISCTMLLFLEAVMIPSLYDNNLVLLKELIFNNLAIVILYPIGLFGTLLFANYSFKELKNVGGSKNLITIISLIGISFIYVFVCIYFSFGIINGFRASHFVAIDNYLIMTIIIIGMYLLINKIMKIKKVKA